MCHIIVYGDIGEINVVVVISDLCLYMDVTYERLSLSSVKFKVSSNLIRKIVKKIMNLGSIPLKN